MDQFPGVVGAEQAIWTLPTTAPQLLPSQPSVVSSRAGLSSGQPKWCAVSPQPRSTSIRSLLQHRQRLGIRASIAWRRTGASQCLVAKHGRRFLKRISLAFSCRKAPIWLSIEHGWIETYRNHPRRLPCGPLCRFYERVCSYWFVQCCFSQLGGDIVLFCPQWPGRKGD